MAEDLGISSDRCYVTYREMAEKEAERADGIDFVIIVTPNSSHFEICKAFLEAGIHVVCDKPVTTTYAQAVELNRLAKSRNLLFMVTYTYMGNVTVKYARELVRQGAIGDIRVIMAEYLQGQDAFVERFDPSQGGWRNDPHFAGNFTEDMIDYPSIKDGAAGLAFIEACLESNKDGNIWKEMCD